MKKQQSGFTLIELVLVIIVLGVLAATAVPKFVDLKGEAEVSALEVSKRGIDTSFTIAIAKHPTNSPNIQDVYSALSSKGKADATANDGIFEVQVGGTTLVATGWTCELPGPPVVPAAAATTDAAVLCSVVVTP